MSVTPLAPSAKAEQLERSFGIRHADKALNGALRKQSDAEVTPFQARAADDRLTWLMTRRELRPLDAAIVMLMGGARLEAIAAAAYTPPNKPGALAEARRLTSVAIRSRLAKMSDDQRERLIGISHEAIALWNHV